MIKEFAVEPAAIVNSYRDFSYVIEKFAVCEGRVISEFPKKWRQMVFSAAQAKHRGTTELSKIEERLRRLPTGVLVNLARTSGDGEIPWVERALIENKQKPFDYILAAETHSHPSVVPLKEFDGEHACLQITREMCIPRNPTEMARACDFLLRTAKHVKLVDPHFDLSQSRFADVFGKFLEALKPGTVIEIYRELTAAGISKEELLRRTNLHLPARLPNDITVRLIGWTKDAMHNRFLLTDLGGAKFGVGLDCAGSGAAQEDEVSLLVPAVWEAKWKRYSDAEDQIIGEWHRP